MPLLFNYVFKNTELFYRLEYQFVKKMNIKCAEFQLILKIIAVDPVDCNLNLCGTNFSRRSLRIFCQIFEI